MRAMGSILLKRCMAAVCMLLLALQADLLTAVSAGAAEMALGTSFAHSAPGYVQTGSRIVISGIVNDPSGIKLARCYFRTDAEANYAFVPMEAGADNSFKAVLPALSGSSQSLQYRLLAVNRVGQISKTNEFVVSVRPGVGSLPDWQTAVGKEPIRVGVEVEPQDGIPQISGFSDNVTVDLVESSARFMLVSGAAVAADMTSSSGSSGAAAGGTTGAAGTASGSGTVMGMRTSTFWWVTAGIVAIVAVAALASSGGGGGGGSNDGTVEVRW